MPPRRSAAQPPGPLDQQGLGTRAPGANRRSDTARTATSDNNVVRPRDGDLSLLFD